METVTTRGKRKTQYLSEYTSLF